MIARAREWALRLALLAVSVAIVVAGLEIWLRSYDQPWGLALVAHPGSPRLARLAPGTTGEIAGVPVRVNGAGYRGRDLAIPKPLGVFRIAFLGDSMTFGWGVREEETFAARLEDALARSRPGRRWEVANFAMIGANTAQAAEAYTVDVARYDPDLVLLGFFMNDVDPPVLASGESSQADEAPAPRVRGISLSRLRTFAFVKTRGAALARRAGIPMRGSTVARYAEQFASRGAAWTACESAIRSLSNQVAADGGRFGVVILPFMVSLDASYPLRDAHEQVATACREAGIPVLDLLPSFLGKSAAALSVTPLDNHMNGEGHGIAASGILAWLIDGTMLDGEATARRDTAE
jgi:lysophospholipase L1-like esterase